MATDCDGGNGAEGEKTLVFTRFFEDLANTSLRVHDAHRVAAVISTGTHTDDRRRREGLDVHLDRFAAAAGRGSEVDRLYVGAVAGIDPVAARGTLHPVVDAFGGEDCRGDTFTGSIAGLISDGRAIGCITRTAQHSLDMSIESSLPGARPIRERKLMMMKPHSGTKIAGHVNLPKQSTGVAPAVVGDLIESQRGYQ